MGFHRKYSSNTGYGRSMHVHRGAAGARLETKCDFVGECACRNQWVQCYRSLGMNERGWNSRLGHHASAKSLHCKLTIQVRQSEAERKLFGRNIFRQEIRSVLNRLIYRVKRKLYPFKGLVNTFSWCVSTFSTNRFRVMVRPLTRHSRVAEWPYSKWVNVMSIFGLLIGKRGFCPDFDRTFVPIWG